MQASGGPIAIASAPRFRRLHLDTVGSTNINAFEAARGGDAGDLWITASMQEQGRGRRGRAWVSERGNLYASLLLIDPGPREKLGELPMVCAVALADAVEAATGSHGLVRLKWPNDLLVDDAKISGILLESETLGDGRCAVVCGFGVNCAHHPDPENYRATDLTELGFLIPPDHLFDRLASAMRARLAQWSKGAGFGAIRESWIARAARLGEHVTIRLGDTTYEGIFRTIDEDGRLVLTQGDGSERRISAGDLFFPTAKKISAERANT
ncbi:biotin--[acetyl-CoA-carboxylase] ligase [Breoghania sp. L-A4]|uniref:biotin--[acetyl-CoA-carboxylase] ligase n=1 Tax=Breoghania sp. L-A4 TaxID=2304600 RepID=UPI000E359CE8|nr:biotin--[acetyl-CoA-carboxylase] ligase [Breoghania sp. L-A4]AXS40400.1 biotin--[acetyl-CoA-carboxylase] ligase [Breoghania sp. L-A4]